MKFFQAINMLLFFFLFFLVVTNCFTSFSTRKKHNIIPFPLIQLSELFSSYTQIIVATVSYGILISQIYEDSSSNRQYKRSLFSVLSFIFPKEVSFFLFNQININFTKKKKKKKKRNFSKWERIPGWIQRLKIFCKEKKKMMVSLLKFFFFKFKSMWWNDC